jgi:hypothetical protein
VNNNPFQLESNSYERKKSNELDVYTEGKQIDFQVEKKKKIKKCLFKYVFDDVSRKHDLKKTNFRESYPGTIVLRKCMLMSLTYDYMVLNAYTHKSK